MFSFGHCLNYPPPSFGQLLRLFRTAKTTFYAYDRKNTNDDDDSNNHYDGNFYDNDDKKYQKTNKYKQFWVKIYQF